MRKRVLTPFYFVLALLIGLSSARAGTYFVGPNGDDTRSPAEASNVNTPWQSIAHAITAASSGDTISVLEGTYNENIVVNKSLYLMANPASATKPILSGQNGENVVTVSAPNVTIHGFQINVSLVGTVYGIRTTGTGWNNLVIEDNDIFSTLPNPNPDQPLVVFSSWGIRLQGVNDQYTIRRNKIWPINLQSAGFGRGISLAGGRGIIGGMTEADSNSTLSVYGIQASNSRGLNIQNNILRVQGIDMTSGTAANHIIRNNRFDAVSDSSRFILLSVKQFQTAGSTLLIEGNTFSNYGNGTSAIFSARANNVTIRNNTFNPSNWPLATNGYSSIAISTKMFTASTNLQPSINGAVIVGNTFNGATGNPGNAITVLNHDVASNFNGGITIGGAGADANTFNAGNRYYVYLDANDVPTNQIAFWGTTPVTQAGPATINLNIQENIYSAAGSSNLPSAMTAEQLFDLEDHLVHKTDVATLGHLSVIPNSAFVTSSSFLAPFTSSPDINRGVMGASNGGQVWVSGGTYNNSVNLNKSVVLLGFNTPIINSDDNQAVVRVTASNVTVQGFELQVNQVGTLYGIYGNNAVVNGLRVLSNRFVGTADAGGNPCMQFNSMGAFLDGIGTAMVTFQGNTFTTLNSNTCVFGRGIRLQGGHGNIGGELASEGNRFETFYGLQTASSAGGSVLFRNNTALGIGIQVVNPGAGTHVISNNNFSIATPQVIAQAVELRQVGNASSVVVENNTFSNHAYFGVFSTRSHNVSVLNNTFTPYDTTSYIHVGVNTKMLTAGTAASQTPYMNGITVKGNTFNAATGMMGGLALGFYNHNNNGTWGQIMVGGAGAEANTFGAGIARYVYLDSASGPSNRFFAFAGEESQAITASGPVTVNINATENNYAVAGGEKLPTTMSADELFELEDKITHKTDWMTLGAVSVVENSAFVTPNSFLAPITTTANVNRGIATANNGGQVWVQAGTYGQAVNVNKQIALRGFGFPVLNASLSTNSPWVVNVAAQNATVEGFQIEVPQVTTIYGIHTNGQVANGLRVIGNRILGAADAGASTNCLQFQSYGMYFENAGTDNFTIQGNTIAVKTLNSCYFGRGIRVVGGGQGLIGGPDAEHANDIIAAYSVQIGDPRRAFTIENNTLRGIGVEINAPATNAGVTTIRNNRFDGIVPQLVRQLVEVKNNQFNGSEVLIENNQFTNYAFAGVFSSRSRNVTVRNNTFTPYDTNTYVHVLVNTKQATAGTAASQTSVVNNITVDGNTFNGAATMAGGIGIGFYNHNNRSTFGNISVANNTFAGSIGTYIFEDTSRGASVTNPYWAGEEPQAITIMSPARANVDATNNNMFDVAGQMKTPANMTNSELYALEDKIVHGIDYDSLGFVAVATNRAWVSNNSFILPYTTSPSLQRAHNVLSDGGEIANQPLAFNEVLNVSKSLTISTGFAATTALIGINMNGPGRTLTLGNQYELSTSLALNAGFIRPNLADLVLTPSAVLTGGSASSYVITDFVGRLMRQGVGAGVTQFPIGTVAHYAPLTYNDANATNDNIAASILSPARRFDFLPALPPNAESFVGLQWLLNEGVAGGSNAEVSVSWPTAAVVGAPLQANNTYKANLAAGGWVSLPTDGTTGTATYSGITNPRSFAIYSAEILSGTVYYVADTGDDARSKTQAQQVETPWRTLTAAIDSVTDGDTIIVINGTFPENITINKQIALIGSIGGNGPKPVINGAASENVITVTQRNVTIKNFRVEVEQVVTLNGIRGNGAFNNLTVVDNHIVGTAAGRFIEPTHGIFLSGNANNNGTGVTIQRNVIAPANSSSALFGRAIRTQSVWGTIGGIQWPDSNSTLALFGVDAFQVGPGPMSIAYNHLRLNGINFHSPRVNSGLSTISNNIFEATTTSDSVYALAEIRNVNNDGASLAISENTFNGFVNYGVNSARSRNVSITGNVFNPAFARAVGPFRHIGLNTKMRTESNVTGAIVNEATIYGNEFNGGSNAGGFGIEIMNHDNRSSFGDIVIGGNGGFENRFAASLERFIALDTASGPTTSSELWRLISQFQPGTPVTLMSPAKVNVNAEGNFFGIGADELTPATMTLAQLYALESKFIHSTYYDSLGFITVTPGTAYVSANSFVAPYTTTPSLQRGINSVMAGETQVLSEVSTFNENVVGKQTTVTGTAGSLTVNGLAMTAMGDTLKLGSPLTVVNTLDLPSGYVKTGANNLTLGAAATVSNTSQNGYVVINGTGRLVKEGVTDQPVLFPVGTASNYAPVTFDDANNTGDNISVGVRSAMQSTSFTSALPTGTTKFVMHEWDINEGTPGGSNATISLSWQMGQVANPPLTAGTSVIARFNGTIWEENQATISAGTATASGFSNFSPFAVYSTTQEEGTIYYVDNVRGDDARPSSVATNPATPWRTIANAVNRVLNNDTIIVFSGTYPEIVNVNKQVALIGAVYDAGNNVAVRPPAAQALEVANKPVVNGLGDGSAGAAVFTLSNQNITIQNFAIVVNQAETRVGIYSNNTSVHNAKILNNVIASDAAGSPGTPCLQFSTYGIWFRAGQNDSVTVRGNLIAPTSVNSCIFGRGIRLDGVWGNIGGPAIADTNAFYTYIGVDAAASWGPVNIENNFLSGNGVGVIAPRANSGNHTIRNNTFNAQLPGLAFAELEIRDNSRVGSTITVEGNNFTNFSNFGVFSSRSNNVVLNNNTFAPADTALNFVSVGVNTKQRTAGAASTQGPVVNGIAITNNTFNQGANNSGTALNIANSNSTGTFGTITFEGNSLTTQLRNYVVLDPTTGPSNGNPIFAGEAANAITQMVPANASFSISNNTFGGIAGTDLSLVQRFATENKVQHAIDYAPLGFVSLAEGKAYVTTSSFVNGFSTAPSLQRAHDVLSANDSVYTQAITAPEVFTVTKDLSVIYSGGAGVSLNGIDMNTNGGSLNLTGNFLLSNSLAFQTQGGRILLNNGNLTLASAATVTGAAEGAYVVASESARLVKDGLGNGTTVLPVGTASSYAPVTITDGNASGDRLEVGVSPRTTAGGFNPSLPGLASAFVGHQWHITETNLGANNASVTLGWNPAAVVNGPLSANVYIARSNTIEWFETPATVGINNATVSGVQSFADLAVFSDDRLSGTLYYVDSLTGDDTRTPAQAQIRATPWATLTNAIAQTQSGDTIVVLTGGTYPENVIVDKQLTILGNDDNGTGLPGTGAKPRIYGNASASVFDVRARNVTIQNFTIEVDQVTTNAGIRATNTDVNNLDIRNNVIISTGGPRATNPAVFNSFGITLDGIGTGFYRIRGNVIAFANDNSSIFGRAIRNRGGYGQIGGSFNADSNLLVGVYGIQIGDIRGGSMLIRNNTLALQGLEFAAPQAGTHRVIRNRFIAGSPENVYALAEIKDNNRGGVVVLDSNSFTGHRFYGALVHRSNNVTVQNNTFSPEAGQSSFVHVQVNTKQRTTGNDAIPVTASATIRGNRFLGVGGIGLQVANHDNRSQLGTITVGGAGTQMNEFASELGLHIALDSANGPTTGLAQWATGGLAQSIAEPAAANITATQNMYGIAGTLLEPSAMTRAQLFLLEGKIQHKTWFNPLGFVTVNPATVYVSNTSFLTPRTTTPSIQRAVNAASDNFSILVQPSTLTENVFVDKTLNLESEVTANSITVGGLQMNGVNKTLTTLSPVNVTGNLIMTEGRVTINNLNLNVLGNISGGSPSSYVVLTTGALIKQNVTDAVLNLPVGLGPFYLPVAIDDANNSGATIAVRARPTSAATDFIAPLPGSVTSFVAAEWDIEKIGGTASNAAVTFGWNDNLNVVNPPISPNTRVLRYNGSSWVRSDATYTAGTISTGSAAGFSEFGRFAIVADPDAIAIATEVRNNAGQAVTSFCAGETIQVTAVTTNTLAAGNQFIVELSNAAGSFAAPVTIGTAVGTTQTIITAVIPAGTAAGTGYRIRVRATDPAFTATDNGTNLTVNPLPTQPVITVQGGSPAICNGTSVTLSAPAGFASYLWSTGATTQDITVSTAGAYTVQVTNANGCQSIASAAVNVTITPRPNPAFSGLPATICNNATAVTLTAVTAGGTFSGQGVTGNTFNPAGLNGNVTITYTVAVNGCDSTATATVNVTPAPDASFTGLPADICVNGAAVTLTPTVAGGTFSGQGVTGNTFNPAGLNGAIQVTYTVTVNGCTSTSTVSVNVNPLPNASFTGLPATVCSNAGAITLVPAVAGGTFSGQGVTGNTFNPAGLTGNVTVTYTLTVAGCTSTSNVVVAVNAAPDASFTGLAANYCVGSTAVTLTPAVAGGTFKINGTAIAGNNFDPTTVGTFTVRYVVSNGGCTDSTEQTVTVNPLPVATFTAPTTGLCVGATITFTPTNAGGSFTINGQSIVGNSFVPNAAGQVIVRYTIVSSAGCTSFTEQTITIGELPDASFTVDSQTGEYCAGQTITFTGAVAGGTYTVNGVAIAGNTFTTTAAGTLTVIHTVTNASGCSASTTRTITVNASSDASFTASTTTLCVNATVTFTAVTAGGTYSVNGTTLNDNTFSSATPGTFAVTYTVTNANGCVSSTTQNITVTDATVSLAISLSGGIETQGDTAIIILPGQSASINATGTPTGGTFVWSSGETTNSITVSPTETTTYTVTYSLNGCTVTRQVKVKVSREIFIPTLFSPNGDGRNDFLQIFGYGITEIDFKVYNRLGNQVYSTTNVGDIVFPARGWDGTANGAALPSDVYTYIIKGKLSNGQEIKVQGRNAGTVLISK